MSQCGSGCPCKKARTVRRPAKSDPPALDLRPHDLDMNARVKEAQDQAAVDRLFEQLRINLKRVGDAEVTE